ncbi:hypothetical protein B0H17DRAFT_1147765 [Mycena rosella]|uniref:Uncharacterized protein n=1 Tax=Mycena rosella TaxID=1033263 RepID=A0AAD7CHM4_MYCRO|nr:hypothetical protein B0H17DRAFT_1147765 [Mycena rosella]
MRPRRRDAEPSGSTGTGESQSPMVRTNQGKPRKGQQRAEAMVRVEEQEAAITAPPAYTDHSAWTQRIAAGRRKVTFESALGERLRAIEECLKLGGLSFSSNPRDGHELEVCVRANTVDVGSGFNAWSGTVPGGGGGVDAGTGAWGRSRGYRRRSWAAIDKRDVPSFIALEELEGGGRETEPLPPRTASKLFQVDLQVSGMTGTTTGECEVSCPRKSRRSHESEIVKNKSAPQIRILERMNTARDDQERRENLATIRHQNVAMIFEFDRMSTAGSKEERRPTGAAINALPAR